MSLWTDLTPSKRCDWIDQLRGWAVIVMIEVHCVNVWMHAGQIPGWLQFLNGLVAPSFITCAGYSLALSTFKTDGTLRPFLPTARRLGFILLCAYALHAPGLTLAECTVFSTPQKLRTLFQVDVLQCIAFSLLLLQAVARLVRRPLVYAGVALGIALLAAWLAPGLWRPGVAQGWWMPIRGLVNGNLDRGVASLFPLLPWIAFAAFGSVLGVLYRHLRVLSQEGRASWSESRWLVALAVLGLLMLFWGDHAAKGWLWDGTRVESEIYRLHNTTLPSVAHRLGYVCLAGSVLGWIELVRGRLPGPNPVEAASRESLLLYMLHLNLIFGILLMEPIRKFTGWGLYSLGWSGTLALTAAIIALNLAAGMAWQRIRQTPLRMWKIQRAALLVVGIYFLAGGWFTFRFFWKSPELARDAYPFLNRARQSKGLAPTPDGMSQDPLEVAREKARIGMKLSGAERQLLSSQRGPG